MLIEVHINGRKVFSEPVEYNNIQPMAAYLGELYNVPLLKSVGVAVEVCITSVKSKMNYPFFQMTEEAEYEEVGVVNQISVDAAVA